MPLATLEELLGRAQKEKYAVGAFNVWDMLSARSVVRATVELSSPVILGLWQPELDFAGESALYNVCTSLGESASVPVVVFIDHVAEIESIERAIDLGATSVMIDGSNLPLAQNIDLTSRAAEIAHRNEVSIEGEIGVLGEESGAEDAHGRYTDPEQAERFAAEAGVDALAVAIGNAHGFYTRAPKLDFDRLERIRARVRTPLVLHGGTGIPDRDLQHAIELGITKVNIGSDGRKAFVDPLRKSLAANPDEVFVAKLFTPALESHTAFIQEKMRILGSAGKA